MTKRNSIGLALVLALFALVQGVWAQVQEIRTEAELIAAASESGTLSAKLVDDITLTQSIIIVNGNRLLLNLNGHVLDRNLATATSAVENGSVFHVKPEGALAINDDSELQTGSITGGYSVKGGGIWNEGIVYVLDGSVKNNRANDCGGIYNAVGAKLRVIGATVSDNWSYAGGGGIVNYGTATITNSTIENNRATTRGSGIWNKGELSINNSVIRGNSIDNTEHAANGGGIHLKTGSVVTLTNVTIENNTSPDGGAIYIEEGATATIDGVSVIQNNTTTKYGGGGITNYGTLSIEGDFTMTGNKSVGNGGGIWSNHVLNMQGNVQIKNNKRGETANNVYLRQDKVISLTGALSTEAGNAEIWVTTEDPSAVVTLNWNERMSGASPENYLKSDVGDVAILDNGVVVFVTPVEPELVGMFRKVTSPTDLIDGAHYILVTNMGNGAAAAGELSFSSGYSEETSYFVAVPITVTEDVASVVENSGVIGFTLQKVNGQYALIHNRKYLYSPSVKNLDFSTEEKACEVSWKNGGFVVSCDGRTLQYNAQSPRFTAYASTQTSAFLYVKTDEASVVLAPTIWGESSFKGSLSVTIDAAGEGETVYYTLDGSDPTPSSAVYTEPIILKESTCVKAISKKGDAVSAVAVREFTALPSFTVVPSLEPGEYFGAKNVVFAMQNAKYPIDGTYTVSMNGETAHNGTFRGDLSLDIATTLTVSISATDASGETFEGSFQYVISPYDAAAGFQLVTDLNSLTAGAQVVFVAEYNGDYYVMGKNGTKNRNAVAVTGSAGNPPQMIAGSNDYGVAMVEVNGDGTFSFSDVANGGYLQSGNSTSNVLKVGSMSDNAHAEILWDEFYSVDVTFGESDRNSLRFNYNNGTPLFSCYQHWFNTGVPVYIYAKTELPTTYGAVTVAADKSWAIIDGKYEGVDAVNIPSDIKVDTVIFNRAFESGVASTIVLPFSITTDKVEGANFYDITGVTKDANGKWNCVGTHRLGKTEVETILANKPYLVKLKDNAENLIFRGKVTLNTSVKQPYTVNGGLWSFRGTYKKFAVGDTASLVGNTYGFTTSAEGEYAKGAFAKGASDARVIAMRCYLVYTGTIAPQARPQMNFRPMMVSDVAAIPGFIGVEFDDGEEGTTVIGKLNTRTGEIRMVPRAADRWLDIQGRVLKAKPTAKGRYFHNGRLEIIK
jgi:hypothetical protein